MSAFGLAPKAPRQNYIVLGKAGIIVPSPGLAVVKKAGSPRKWNEMVGYGVDGASLVYAGTGLSSFDVDIFIWKEPQHWVEWEIFAPLLAKPIPLPLGLAAPEFALSIQHPVLNAKPWDIQRVVVEDVSSWEQDDFGKWGLTIKFKAYRKPKPVLVKTLEATPGVNAGIPVPKDPAEVMIAELQAKNAALGAKLK